jgi:hypothetical protein
MKILLGDFNEKLRRWDIFKQTIGNGVYIRIVMMVMIEQ